MIATVQKSLSSFPRSHPEYIAHVQILAKVRFERYKLSHQKEDLDKSILHFNEAIFLPDILAKPFLNAVQTLFNLAIALLSRSEEFKQSEDIKSSIEYLRHLRGFPLDSFDLPRTDVTTSLTQALRTQVRLGAGNGTQDINEMVVLCIELLSSRQSAAILAEAFSYLREAAEIELNRGLTTEMIDDVIECLREAVKAYPPGSYDAWHQVVYALAFTLHLRFLKTHSKKDCEEADALLEKILEPGGCPDAFRDEAFKLSVLLAFGRSVGFLEPEYSEVAISRLRAYFGSPSLDEEDRLAFASAIATQTGHRFREFSIEESLEEANSYISQLVDASSSSSLAESAELSWPEGVRETFSATDIQQKIEYLEDLLSIAPPGTERYIECLRHLERWYESKFCHTNNISDIEEAIKYSRLVLDATHASDQWRFSRLGSLGSLFRFAFDKTRRIIYLEESITICYDILECKIPQMYHFSATRMLVLSLLTRERLLGRIEDRHEAIRLISVVIDNEYGRESDRFKLACEWAITARRIHHPTTLAAYKTAMSLMERSLSFAPTVSTQHTRLLAMGAHCQTMPLDYASYQIGLGQFEEAVETLEQGRALLWSEMRGLRTPVFQVIEEDSLAKKFAEINQELETLTIAVTPSGRPEVDDGIDQSKDGSDAFGRLVIKQKKLVEVRDALISQIRSRPGLEGFLRAPSYTTLHSAASRGPVIIVNHCQWRSDIIIIFHNYLPCFIPTNETFFARANKLRDKLVEARKPKGGLDSKEYQDALCSVLKGLYELVGEPIIKRLRLLGVPEQSRIWWCPTSVFCSLPLHSMGPIPSTEPGKPRYFSDLYIPSYTPSLSALIDSRKASRRTLEKPSLLLVAQPDHNLPGVKGEIKVIRKLGEQVSVTGLVSSNATPTSVIDGLRGNQLAHFACHGVLETGKPFEASFKLHEGERLTLLEIVRSRLPDAEFVFLSCCHAAEITADSVSDEALHLTAAMQYCGFRSVVGTMWAMADTDGRDLAKNFYKSLFSRRDSSVPYYERSAEALRDATQKLRGKRGISLERWVNFVHYGA
jgi:tetratricopeptide (TPR) repeat protein